MSSQRFPTLMTLCSTTESSHSMKDSTVAFFLSSSFSSWKTVTESSAKMGNKNLKRIRCQKQASCWLQWYWKNIVFFFFCLTLRVNVRVRVSPSCHSQQRLRADAAQVHFVNVRYHAGHHSLVKQSRACNLETDGGTRLLFRFAVPVLCCATCGSLFCSTWARCKKEVCLLSDDTKCRAMGSFLAARHSGRFSSDEASQRSQCLAKLRISDKRLIENFSTSVNSLVYWGKSPSHQAVRKAHTLGFTLSIACHTEKNTCASTFKKMCYKNFIWQRWILCFNDIPIWLHFTLQVTYEVRRQTQPLRHLLHCRWNQHISENLRK